MRKLTWKITLIIAAAPSLFATGCANMNKTQKGAAAGGLLGNCLDRRQKELQQVVQTEKTDNGLLVTMKGDVLFDFDRTNLKGEAETNLTELAHILGKYPKDKLRVIGYDHMIGDEMSLGASAQVLWTMWKTTETTSSAFVVAKYWF